MKLGLVEHGEETAGFGLDPALATGPRDGTVQPVVGESGSRGRSGRDRQNRSCLARQQPLTFVYERLKDCRVVLAQARTEPIVSASAVPERVLLGSREDGNRSGQVGVVRQRPMLFRIGPQDVRHYKCILVIGLLAGDSHRIDGIDPSAGGPQAGHQESAGGLDRNRDRVLRVVAVLGEQSQQAPEARRVVADPELAEQSGIGVDHGNVVMILRQSIPQVTSNVRSFRAFASVRHRAEKGPPGDLVTRADRSWWPCPRW